MTSESINSADMEYTLFNYGNVTTEFHFVVHEDSQVTLNLSDGINALKNPKNPIYFYYSDRRREAL